MNDRPAQEPREILDGPVHVVGAGLLGTSIGLALSGQGLTVWLSDADQAHVRTAAGLGAGIARPNGQDAEPALTVVCVPPRQIAGVVAEALRGPGVVTDVGSVKGDPLRVLEGAVPPADLSRYVGSHPMAGSERSGPLAASSALFEGRPWAVTPHPGSDPAAVDVVRRLAVRCGATVIEMSPGDHDGNVARTSHLPHLMSALVAGRLAGVDTDRLQLSGQGLRDVTRIAASDPALWRQIIGANASAVADLLAEVRTDLDRLIGGLRGSDGETLDEILAQGVAGTRQIPGKHGLQPIETAAVFVVVPDHPGELSRLFADVGEIGINVEDVWIDHDPGRPYGLMELTIAADVADELRSALESREWVVHR